MNKSVEEFIAGCTRHLVVVRKMQHLKSYSTNSHSKAIITEAKEKKTQSEHEACKKKPTKSLINIESNLYIDVYLSLKPCRANDVPARQSLQSNLVVARQSYHALE